MLAIGDLNPLWLSAEHGTESPFDTNLAPPYMVFAVAPWTMHAGVFLGARDEEGERVPLPGAGGAQGGIEIEWLRPLRSGDFVECEARLASARTLRGGTRGRTFELVAEFSFRDADAKPIARAWFTWLGFEKRAERAGQAALATKTWTHDEVEEIRAEYAQQPGKTRGSDVRYWEDVSVGDSLPTILKGPYTEASFMTFCTAFPLRNANAADEVYWNHVYEDNILGVPQRGALGANELTPQGVPTGPRYHFDYESARRHGVPAPFDVPNQRVVWLIQLATMWMGDAGFLKELKAQHVDLNMMGDLSRCTGVVSQKEIRGDEHLVRCELTSSTHRGPSTTASCVVALPSREHGG